MCRLTWGALALAAVLALSAAARPIAAQSSPGAQLTARGAVSYALYCAACHGGNGGGNPASHAPELAGRAAAALARQLSELRHAARAAGVQGKRPHANALAQLNAEDIEGIAEYLASLAPPPPAAH
jgi:cytochrome c553